MSDFREATPAVLTLLAIPLTFSIAEGIGLGLITSAILALTLRESNRMIALGYVLAGILFLELFHLWPFRA